MSQSDNSELYGLIRDLSDKVGALAVTVGRIDERMKTAEGLEETAKGIEQRVANLELTRAQMQGVGMAGRAIWAFIGAGGVGVVIGFIQLLKHAN